MNSINPEDIVPNKCHFISDDYESDSSMLIGRYIEEECKEEEGTWEQVHEKIKKAYGIA